MVLNNYWSALAGLATHSYNTGNGYIRNVAYCKRMTDGDLVGVNHVNSYSATSPDSPHYYTKTVYAPLANLKFFLGSGTTNPQASDYKLQTDITSSFSNIVVNYQTICEDSSCKLYCVITGVNNTGGTLNITEMGIGKLISYSLPNDNEYYQDNFLYVREVLGSPITVPSGLGFSLTLEWVMS